jgi:transposase-like protein
MHDKASQLIAAQLQDLEICEPRKAAKTPYSDEDRYIALAAVDLNGGNVYRTAVALGIPASTLREWNDARHVRAAEFAEGRKEKRGNLRDKIEATVHSIVEGITPEKIAKATLSQSFVAIGIGWDKIYGGQDQELDPLNDLYRMLNIDRTQLPTTLQLEPGEEIPAGFGPIIDTKSNADGSYEVEKPGQSADANATEDTEPPATGNADLEAVN